MATPRYRHNMKPVKWIITGKTLLTLDLSDQQMSELPDEIFKLNELQALKLNKNENIQLSEKLVRLTNLKVLRLDDCNINTVPAAVMKLTQLETLSLRSNKNITLPEEMSGLVNLTVMHLDNCDLQSVPAVAMKLTQLKTLILSNNKNITLPDSMSRLVNLTALVLDNCNLYSLPAVVLKLSHLHSLDLSHNFLIFRPDELCKLENIKVLKLCGCSMATVPPAILKLSQLEELDLSENSGIHLPDGLAGLTNIRVLRLCNCDLGTVPPAVLKLTRLEELYLSWNRGIHLPDGLSGLTNIRVLKLWRAGMVTVSPVLSRRTLLELLDLRHNPLHTLPAEVGQLTNVKHLDLSLCQLRTLPPEVGRLAQLEWLNLSHNELQTLPVVIGQLTNVKHLDLSLCQLRKLPPEVGSLAQLKWLDLSHNELQTLPADIGHLTNVKHLDLSWCQLRKLPPEVGGLTQLEWLDLRNNPLQTLPVEVGQLTNVKHLYLYHCRLNTLPPEVGRLTQLEWLDLRYNPLQTLPAEVGQLTNVKHLDLSYCELRTLPIEVWRLTQLEWLNLRSNPLQTLPAEVGQLANIKHLILFNCQLHTLPPEVGRLTQLKGLYLSSNRLQTLPAEVGQLTNIKHLDLSNCQLHTLPPEVGRLTQLKGLYLSRNRLQTLPADIGQLTNVKHLDLSNCQICTLPPEVGRLTQLEGLHLHHNPLQTLPAEVGQLNNVKHLFLSHCELRTLPTEVGRLTQLKRLDLRSNLLQTLPRDVVRLSSLSHLEVSENPLRKPPAEVCRQGITAIRQYFKELELSEEEVSARLKIVVMGQKMAGKTSLVQTLHRGVSTLTEEEDRTHCVEITQWAPDDNITFEVYDFGGHDVYHLTHQFFLTTDAFNLLIVDLHKYRCTDQSYNEAVGFWLDTLNARAPGAVVTIVGSKTDVCSGIEIEEKNRDIQKRFTQQHNIWQRTIQQQIKRLKSARVADGGSGQREVAQQLERTRQLLTRPLRLTGLCCVSSKGRTSGLDTLKTHVVESANNAELFPTLRIILPQTWVKFEQGLRDLRNRVTDEYQSAESPSNDEPHIVRERSKKSKWLTQEECLQQGQFAGLTADRLEPVLSYLHQVGTILRYPYILELKELIFHYPPSLIDLFKDLFHHDTKALFSTARLQNANYTHVQLERFKQELRDCGLIRKDVLTCMLSPDVAPDIVTALMQDFGLCFEVRAEDKTDPSKHICHYRIPWYLYKQMPEELMSVWPEVLPEEQEQEQLQLMCDIRGFCPRGLFQRFSVGIHPLVKDRTDWKDGVMAYRQDYPVLVCSKPDADDTYITIATRGRLAQAGGMWGVVLPLLEVLVQLLQEWPGVLYSIHVTCAHCIKARLDNPHQYDLRDRTEDDGRDVRCPRVKMTASTSADLVYRPSRLSVGRQRFEGQQDVVRRSDVEEEAPYRDLKRPQGQDASGNPPKKFKGERDEVDGTSEDSPSGRKPVVLLVNDEFGTSKGGISTINGQLLDLLTPEGATVLCTVLNATKEEIQEAQSHGIHLVVPDTPEGDKRPPTLDWLTYDHKSRYPNLPSDISVIVGHADVTSTAARNIKKERLPSAKFILYNHVMPEDTEHHKSGDKVMGIGDKMDAIRKDTEEADVVFSVGPTMHDYYKSQIKLSKPHHLFLPKPSDIFSQMNVTYVETETKVVLTVGRVKGVEKLKGYDLVAKSMGKVLDRFPKARWRARGVSKEDFPESKELIEANVVKGKVRFTPLEYGTQEQLSGDFKEAHLVLMPSRAEPFGLVGLEAIAAGVPVLVSSNSGLAEFLESKGPEFDRPIVDMDGSDDVVAERLAKRIIKVLKGGPAEFEASKRLKDNLLASKYWEESHRKFLEECGISQ